MTMTIKVEEITKKLADLAVKGDLDAYTMLGYVLRRTETEEGCWTLDGKNLNQNGYTFFTLTTRRAAGHRLLIEVLQESLVPQGMVVDHVCHSQAAAERTCAGGLGCRHRACFNPDHMEIITQSENVMRGSNGFWNKDECSKGHSRDPEHIRYRKQDGKIAPYCWSCHKIKAAKFKRNNRAKLKSMGLKEKRYDNAR